MQYGNVAAIVSMRSNQFLQINFDDQVRRLRNYPAAVMSQQSTNKAEQKVFVFFLFCFFYAWTICELFSTDVDAETQWQMRNIKTPLQGLSHVLFLLSYVISNVS